MTKCEFVFFFLWGAYLFHNNDLLWCRRACQLDVLVCDFGCYQLSCMVQNQRPTCICYIVAYSSSIDLNMHAKTYTPYSVDCFNLTSYAKKLRSVVSVHSTKSERTKCADVKKVVACFFLHLELILNATCWVLHTAFFMYHCTGWVHMHYLLPLKKIVGSHWVSGLSVVK